MIFELFFTVVLVLVLFWQGSLLFASMIGSPIVYANKRAVSDAIELANPDKGQLFIDLGCGNGHTLILAAKKFGLKCVGVDRSLFCYLKAKLNIFLSGEGKNIKVFLGDFRKIEKELQKADIVYLYLLNSVLAKIENWLFANIGDNTKIVSLAFEFPNHQPIGEKETKNLNRITKIRLY